MLKKNRLFQQILVSKFLMMDSQKFNALIEDINQAKHHVHMEYYIFRMDRTGHEIYDALLAAAKRGVEVKLLIDAWGSNKTKMSSFKELQEAGGHVAQFFPLIMPLVNPRTNYRLHRKIVVIDGVVAIQVDSMSVMNMFQLRKNLDIGVTII